MEIHSYGYSAVGQRLYMQRADGRGDLYGYDAGTTTWVANEVRTFVYDAWNVIREGVVDTSTGGSAQTQVKRYTWGIDLSGSRQGAGGVGGLLMVEEDNDPSNAASPLTAYYYTNDANGNVTTITDTSGVAVAQYEYDAYGNVVASVGAYATENPYRYSTKYSDDESGWLYYGFRYYMPETGRWASRDPIGEAGGVNLYGFVYNNPLNWFDVLGRDPSTFPNGPAPIFDDNATTNNPLGDPVGPISGSNCYSTARDGKPGSNSPGANPTDEQLGLDGCSYVPAGPCGEGENEVIISTPANRLDGNPNPPIEDPNNLYHAVGSNPQGCGYHQQTGDGGGYYNNISDPTAADQEYWDQFGEKNNFYPGEITRKRYCCPCRKD